ncbi:hypothetical protein [Azospirillum lipoferum]|uniref:Uncharacterized protein n=1 Tax=Azospirillum lipoferum (strain 4B) TaxID=862719 RepID=G7ZHF8_AZOL4|nr:hypothetical protein [Azospirillum lipoferum]CBS91277.1 Protein of unknown function [Azospirillum lipoferum 4B]
MSNRVVNVLAAASVAGLMFALFGMSAGTAGTAGTADPAEQVKDRQQTMTGAQGKGIGDWSDGDLTLLLDTGLTPEGDIVGGAMGEVVRNSTSKLTAEGRAAIAA